MGYGVPDSGVDFHYITATEGYLLMKNDKAVFVDGRDKEDFDKSHLQCSYHLSANDLILHPDKIDKSVVQLVLELIASGRTLVALSDNCITGAKNRGHVSRCRHIAQYFVEMGADKSRCVRMTGGINAWKKLELDGVMGDLRLMFAGNWVKEDFKTPNAGDDDEDDENKPEEAPSTQPPQPPPAAESGDVDQTPLVLEVDCRVEICGLKSRADLNGKKAKVLGYFEDAGRWEVELVDDGDNKEHVRCKPDNLIVKASAKSQKSASAAPVKLPTIQILSGGDPKDGTRNMIEVIKVPPRPFKVDTPTCYRVLKSELFRKPTKDSDKISKIERPLNSFVRTTGELYTGQNGGIWAELDVTAGEKKGWIYIAGPGFGPTSRKIKTEYMQP